MASPFIDWIVAHPVWTAFICLGIVLILVILILVTIWAVQKGLRVRVVTTKNTVLRNAQRQMAGTRADHSDMTIFSLKYAIGEVQLAQDATLVGTGYNNPVGAISAKLQPVEFSSKEYASFHQTEAETNTRVVWYDLMDKALLDQKLNEVSIKKGLIEQYSAKKFQFCSVNYLQPLKIKAKATFSDGTTMVTKKGHSVSTGRDASGFETFQAVADTLYTEGDAEEAIITMGNGGIFVRLAEPIELTAKQIEESRLTLIYDPYLLLRATKASGSEEKVKSTFYPTDEHGSTWHIPIMSMTPIVVGNTDHVVRDVFQIERTDTTSAVTYHVLIVLYSLQSDRLVKNASLAIVDNGVDALPMSQQMSPPQPFFMARDGDAWSLEDYKHRPLVSGLKNEATGTCNVHAYDDGGGSPQWGIYPSENNVTFTRIIAAEIVD